MSHRGTSTQVESYVEGGRRVLFVAVTLPTATMGFDLTPARAHRLIEQLREELARMGGERA